ncbi:MAG: hypothetical protein MJY75_01775 [Bacteroidaceae bacterium]|nr:hypothetical protein [Bacteroidaceae bacterium]
MTERLIPEKRNMPVHVLMVACLVLATACSKEDSYLKSALRAAGDNRHELELVLQHYQNADRDKQKLEAACFLISNMPAHYSYSNPVMDDFYSKASAILGNGSLTAMEQRDSIKRLYDMEYAQFAAGRVSDIRIMTSDYLIASIDRAFEQWRGRSWNDHVDFEQFKEWLLPYKGAELQPFDDWRGLLGQKYSDAVSELTQSQADSLGTYGAIDMVRNEIHTKNTPNVFWEDENGPSLLSAECLASMTYGTCHDYVTMGTLVFRSLGLPAAVDHVPLWGRNHEGHSWFVFLSDHGNTIPTVNSLIMPAGIGFYQYERIPKVWRSCYSINRRVLEYLNTSAFAYPFDPCMADVTGEYGRTYNIEVPLSGKARLREKYVYIAMAANCGGPSWRVLDFGKVRGGKARFSNMGGQMLYIALGYDGKGLVPVSSAFTLGKDGRVELIPGYGKCKPEQYAPVRLYRKYYESYNVVSMRSRMIGGTLECSDHPDFRQHITAGRVDSVSTSVVFDVAELGAWRCWRYRSPDGSYGSLSEMEMTGKGGMQVLGGRPVSNSEAGADAAARAFDGNLLTNFESDVPDGNWVGMDYGCPVGLERVRLFARSDDNDIVPGLDYDLMAWNGSDWVTLTSFHARNGYFDVQAPRGVLLWLRCRNRGMNERPFVVDDDNAIVWW